MERFDWPPPKLIFSKNEKKSRWGARVTDNPAVSSSLRFEAGISKPKEDLDFNIATSYWIFLLTRQFIYRLISDDDFHTFCWEQYLRSTGSIAAPNQLFKTVRNWRDNDTIYANRDIQYWMTNNYYN